MTLDELRAAGRLEELTAGLPSITVGDPEALAGLPRVVARTDLGGAVDPWTGCRYRVVATRHDRDWPGTDSPLTFAVERTNPKGMQDACFGFFDEVDCWRFLTGGGLMELTYPGRDGEPVTELRRCLGIPDGYVRKES